MVAFGISIESVSLELFRRYDKRIGYQSLLEIKRVTIIRLIL